MTSFDTRERSNYSGEPITLYEFRFGTTRWLYASADRDIVVGSDVYVSAPVSNEGASFSGDPSTEDFSITVPRTIPLVSLFVGAPPSETVFAYLREIHYGDSDAPITWVGTVAAVEPQDAASAKVTAVMLTASFTTNGLRLSWGRGCPHALYDRLCTVDKSLYAVVGVVSSISGLKVDAAAWAAKPDGWFSGGFIEWPTIYGATERRTIRRHVGAEVQLMLNADSIEVGDSITAYPGCKRTTDDCANKFDNILNYGGFPDIPGKSPFDGTRVF